MQPTTTTKSISPTVRSSLKEIAGGVIWTYNEASVTYNEIDYTYDGSLSYDTFGVYTKIKDITIHTRIT